MPYERLHGYLPARSWRGAERAATTMMVLIGFMVEFLLIQWFIPKLGSKVDGWIMKECQRDPAAGFVTRAKIAHSSAQGGEADAPHSRYAVASGTLCLRRVQQPSNSFDKNG